MTRRYTVIEKHRNAQVSGPTAPTLEQLQVLKDSLALTHYSLDYISNLLGMESSRVIDEVAKLGKWLIHTNGGIDVETVTHGSLRQMSLFQESQLVPGPVTLGKGSKAKAAAAAGMKLSTRKVVLPAGFEPGRNGRDVSRALAAIVVYNPDESTLLRYVARTYPTVRQSVLSFTILSSVWKFAELGFLEQIDEVSPENPGFMPLVVSAFDVLDGAIANAHEGISELLFYAETCDPSGDGLDLESVQVSCLKARALNEAEISRLQSRLQLAHERGSRSALATELRFFAQRVAAQPNRYRIDDISQLSASQVRRIAESHGIPTGGADRSLENDIREHLRALGLETDLDQMVPAGVQASQLGFLDDFYEAIAARVSGDPTWVDQLSELFDKANA
jgi:hypothetical protein